MKHSDHHKVQHAPVQPKNYENTKTKKKQNWK